MRAYIPVGWDQLAAFDATGRLATNGNIKEADGVSPVFSSALYEENSRRRRNES